MASSSRLSAFVILAFAGCGTGDAGVDPGDLELRDLLGISPEVAQHWDASQRHAALLVVDDALARPDGAVPSQLALPEATTLDDRVVGTLGVLDASRFADGLGALGLVRLNVTDGAAVIAGDTAPPLEDATTASSGVQLAPAWTGDLANRGAPALSALAAAAGYRVGDVIATPVSRLAAVAAYVESAGQPARLIVNPIAIAALEPTTAAEQRAIPMVAVESNPSDPRAPTITETPRVTPDNTGTASGNPYSFYGSVEECAAAQEMRCASCLAANNCAAITSKTTGSAECQALGSNGTKGYFEICIDLALAINSVSQCVTSASSSCVQDTTADDSLATLSTNDDFLTGACASALDGCLAQIYGAPSQPYPNLDGGISSQPARSTSVSCGNSCSSPNSKLSPDCNCSGPSCNNSLSCDTACSNSNSQGQSCGNCDSCDSGTGTSGGTSGGCSCGNSSSGGGGGGGGCGGCGGTSSSSGCGGGGCGGNSSGGGCGGGGGGCGGTSSGNGCNVAKPDPGTPYGTIIAIGWSLLPVVAALWSRRRHRRRGTVDGAGEGLS